MCLIPTGDEPNGGVANSWKVWRMYRRSWRTSLSTTRRWVPSMKREYRKSSCQKVRMILGKKFSYVQLTALWWGYQLSKEGYTVNPELVEGPMTFPIPKNHVDICSFSRLVQQFEAFSTDTPELVRLLRSLLLPRVALVWEGLQQQAFDKLIKVLMLPRVLAHYQWGSSVGVSLLHQLSPGIRPQRLSSCLLRGLSRSATSSWGVPNMSWW